MANVRNGNSFYIDTVYAVASDELAAPVLVQAVFVTATAANARVVLSDSNGDPKADLRVATSGETKMFRFADCPISFPTGIRPTTLTNAIVTAVGVQKG